jgi:acetyl esterase/lipase
MVFWKHQVSRPFSDHTYATKHGVKLDLRVWPAEGLDGDGHGPAPWILYTHGGAFAAGKHYLINAWVIPGFKPRGYHVVSVGYRLLPHASLRDMVDDCEDAFKWCRNNLEGVVGQGKVDLEKYAVAGESAGGTLATILGHVLSPPPRAVVDIYGAVDFTDKRPRSPADIQPLTEGWSEEEVAEAIAKADPTQAITVCPFQFDIPVEYIREQWGFPDYEYTQRQVFQYEIKKYLRTYDLLWDVMCRINPEDSDDVRDRKIKQLSPMHMLEGKTTYPPTFFLHGGGDPVVPQYLAERMAAKLRVMGVPIGEAYEPGEIHEFDNKYTVSAARGWGLGQSRS